VLYLSQALGDEDLIVQQKASEALRMLGQPALEELNRALTNEDRDVRLVAIFALAEKKDRRAVPSLITLMTDEDPAIRVKTVNALGEIGDARAVAPLIQAYFNDTDIAKQAASALISILQRVGEAGVEPISRALMDDNYRVRQRAAKLLDAAGLKPVDDVEKIRFLFETGQWDTLQEAGDSVVGPLLEMLNQKGYPAAVRSKLVRTLGKTRDPKVVETLARVLKDDESVLVRTEAVKALAEIEMAGAIEILIRALKEDEDSRVREKAVTALGKTDDMRALESLCWSLMREEPNVRRAAAEAILRRGDIRAGDLIIAHLIEYNDYEDLAIKVLQGLSKLGWEPGNDKAKAAYLLVTGKGTQLVYSGGERFVQPLIEIFNDAVAAGSRWLAPATEILGQIGDARAFEPIIKHLFQYPEDYTEYLDEAEERGWSPYFCDSNKLSNLFGDYTALIVKAARGFTYKAASPIRMEYNLRESNAAVNKLCAIVTPIASNILHEVSRRPDLPVTCLWVPPYDTDELYVKGCVDFKKQRMKAIAELQRRGNPPDDPSAYLAKGERWRM
jgi:HEAT repeat protein